jgi:uncharacterized protein YecT (DUF1311 family)
MTTASASMGLLAGVLVAFPDVTLADGLPYRGQCPEPMNLVETEAYFCRTMGYKKLGTRVEAAYEAQVAKLRQKYDKPEYSGHLKHELDVLEASQKSWKTYVANQCASEGYMAWQGSLEPQLVGQCAERLTELRISELEKLTKGMGN